MTDLPTMRPFDIEDGGPAAEAKKDGGAPDIDASETTDSSSSITIDDLEGDAGRLGPRPEQQQQAQHRRVVDDDCCECAAEAALAALAVTYVVTSVLLVLRDVSMLVWVLPSAFVLLLWNYIACRFPERFERSANASVAFFFFDMIHLANLTGSPVPVWVLLGVWFAPVAISIGAGLALVAYAAAVGIARAARGAVAAAVTR
jgi:hypothetical protein